MGDPPVRCPGQLVDFGDGDVICDLGIECEAFVYLVDDFATYREAHADAVSADVLMDPDGEI